MEGAPGSVVSADGTRIGFITGGEGPALLMVHGGMCSSARWAPLWPFLVGRFQVTAMDRRGRGSSGDGKGYSLAAEYSDVIAVADHLSARQGRPVDIFGIAMAPSARSEQRHSARRYAVSCCMSLQARRPSQPNGSTASGP
jgi:pimeloyl-ACP methyl ester carboxylesterase